MQVQITQHTDGVAGATIEISDHIFSTVFNEPLIHQVVTAYMAGGRSGSKKNKTRREVSGGGIKPWRQKGTGRARAGSIRSPLWRGGGVTFAAKPRSFQQKINRKMYVAAMRSIFAELLRQGYLTIVDDFSVSAAKTREMLAKLKNLNLDNVLIITFAEQQDVILASRNIPKVEVIEVAHVNPVCLLAFDKVLITQEALKHIEERLA